MSPTMSVFAVGSICDKVLSKSNIELTYKSLRDKKNPYIWRLKDDIYINIKH